MMLELTIKDFTAATKKKGNVFQGGILNTLQKMEKKTENLSKEIKDIDKNQMENFKMKSTIAKAKPAAKSLLSCPTLSTQTNFF